MMNVRPSLTRSLDPLQDPSTTSVSKVQLPLAMLLHSQWVSTPIHMTLRPQIWKWMMSQWKGSMSNISHPRLQQIQGRAHQDVVRMDLLLKYQTHSIFIIKQQ